MDPSKITDIDIANDFLSATLDWPVSKEFGLEFAMSQHAHHSGQWVMLEIELDDR